MTHDCNLLIASARDAAHQSHSPYSGVRVGAATFGIGWGLAGFCPEPVLVGVAAGLRDAWIFVPAMLADSLVAGRFASQ